MVLVDWAFSITYEMGVQRLLALNKLLQLWLEVVSGQKYPQLTAFARGLSYLTKFNPQNLFFFSLLKIDFFTPIVLTPVLLWYSIDIFHSYISSGQRP